MHSWQVTAGHWLATESFRPLLAAARAQSKWRGREDEANNFVHVDPVVLLRHTPHEEFQPWHISEIGHMGWFVPFHGHRYDAVTGEPLWPYLKPANADARWLRRWNIDNSAGTEVTLEGMTLVMVGPMRRWESDDPFFLQPGQTINVNGVDLHTATVRGVYTMVIDPGWVELRRDQYPDFEF